LPAVLIIIGALVLRWMINGVLFQIALLRFAVRRRKDPPRHGSRHIRHFFDPTLRSPRRGLYLG
jgi:hypothetical protein